MAPISENRLRIEATLPDAVRDMWASGAPMTNLALARRCHGTEWRTLQDGKRVERASTTFHNVLQSMERRGVMVRQAAPHAGNPERRTAPAQFNWSSLDPSVATLRHAVEPYLADAEVPIARRRALRSALRVVLPPWTGFVLRQQCPDHEILKAAARYPAGDVHALISRLRELSAGTLSPKTVEGYTLAIRQLMHYAARRDVLPLGFPPTRSADAWEQFMDAYWPLARRGTSMSADARRGRRLWRLFRTCCDAAFGPALPADPAAMTAQQAWQAIQHGGSHLGLRQQMAGMRAILFALRDEHGVGPFAGLEPNPYLVRTSRGLSPRFYLKAADGFCASGTDWDGLMRIVCDSLPPTVADEWVPFIRWYRDYCSLPWSEISRRRDEFPVRAARRELDQSTQGGRIMALRAWLGVALHELRLDGASLTPTAVLGVQYGAIKNCLWDLWRERAALAASRRKAGLPCEDRISDGESSGLIHHVLGAGLWALALYEWLRFRRGLRIAMRRGGESAASERVDTLSELLADKTDAEATLLGAYIEATAFADNVEKDRLKRVGSLATAKSLTRIIDMMPADRWVSIHTAMLEQLGSWRDSSRIAPGRLHRLAMDTLYTGVLISTACREAEAAHLRLDIHFPPRNRAARLITWRGIDRPKTEKGHNGVLRPEIVPDWLLALVLERSRPYLMREQWVEKRRPERMQDHQFLFVNEMGRAIGCVEEDVETGNGRDMVAMKARLSQQSRRWLSTVCRFAKGLGIAVPIEHGELGEHALRAAMGYAVYRHRGKQAASQLLGNTEDVLMQSYAILDARQVDVAALPGFEPLHQEDRQAPSTAPEPLSDPRFRSFAEERDAILERATAAGLPGDVTGLMIREAAQRWQADQAHAGPVLTRAG